jgi:hypothetical protein
MQQTVNSTSPIGESAQDRPRKRLGSQFRHAPFTWHLTNGKDECRAAP